MVNTMELLNQMEIGDSKLYSSNLFSGEYNQSLYIKKAANNKGELPKYYINICFNKNGNVVRQGYLYFYLDSKARISEFIGISVSPEYRNLNIGSLLIAVWIDLCLNNGYDFLVYIHTAPINSRSLYCT